MKKIFVTRKLLKENEEKLKELFDAKLNPNDQIYTAKEIIGGSKDFDGILSSVTAVSYTHLTLPTNREV